MELRADLITLAVPDLEAAHRYYVDGLGWEPALAVPGEVTFLRAGSGRMVALFGAEDLAADIGDGGPVPQVNLAHNVGTQAEVDAVVEAMVAAGGRLRKAPQRAAFGGYHAYVEAPDGTLWEIAHNPGWRVDADGTTHLGPVD